MRASVGKNVQISITDQHCWMKALSNWLETCLRVTDSNGKLLGYLTHTETHILTQNGRESVNRYFNKLSKIMVQNNE